jgi:hypothetical protein
MAFHRTPQEMANDVSYGRSPGCGESASRHMLWLTQADLDEIGPEPQKAPGRLDFDDPVAVAAEREHSRIWKIWWGKISIASQRRQSEAHQDPAWTAEYHRLLKLRQEAGPAEFAAMQAKWEAYDALHPQRGLSEEEKTVSGANWERRWALCREHNAIAKKSKDDPRLADILAEMKLCDRRNDAWVALGWSRPTLGEDAPALARIAALSAETSPSTTGDRTLKDAA